MKTNAELIEMHLFEMLNETKQIYQVRWHEVLAYCIGYYEVITLDHVVAIKELERLGYIKKGDFNG